MAPQGGDRLKQVPSMTGDRAVERALGGVLWGAPEEKLSREPSPGVPLPHGHPCQWGASRLVLSDVVSRTGTCPEQSQGARAWPVTWSCSPGDSTRGQGPARADTSSQACVRAV